MPTYYPAAINAIIANPDEVYGYVEVPGTVMTTGGTEMNGDSSVIEDGRFHAPTGEIYGRGEGKRQDTYLTGTSGRTGKAFTASGGGTWNPNAEFRQLGFYWLHQQDSAATLGSESVLTAVDTTDGVEDFEIIIGRGYPPVSATINTYNKQNSYCYIELAADSPDKKNLRIAIEYGDSIAFDETIDGGVTWNRKKQCRSIGNVERYLESNNNTIRLRGHFDRKKGTCSLENGDGHMIYHAPSPGVGGIEGAIPQTGKIKLRCKNGWTGFAYLPMRYRNPKVKPTPRTTDRRHQGKTPIVVTPKRDGQTVTSNTNANAGKITPELTATRDDAGDGLGSILPPKFSTVTIILPSQWTYSLSGSGWETPQFGTLLAEGNQELEVWDDVTRTRYHSCLLACDNTYHQYSGSYGRVALNLQANVGTGWYQRMCGYGGDGEQGIQFVQSQVTGQMLLPGTDKSIALQVPLLDEVDFDGWHWTSKVHFLLSEKGNIHPSFARRFIPVYVPPGATYEYPYGEAGDDAQGYVIGKGIGNQPIERYHPDDMPWRILQEMAMRMTETDPYTGRQAPYMLGFDAAGFPHFEPISYFSRTPVAFYSEEDRYGALPIFDMEGGLRVYNSVAQMRTDLHFQTIDNRTGDLLYQYLPMPNWVKRSVGFAFGWLERDAKFGNQEGLDYAIQSAAYNAALPQQTIRFVTWYRPEIFAGDTIRVQARALRGAWDYVILSQRSIYGANRPGIAIIEARRKENLL